MIYLKAVVKYAREDGAIVSAVEKASSSTNIVLSNEPTSKPISAVSNLQAGFSSITVDTLQIETTFTLS